MTIEEFLTLYPKFSDIDDAVIQRYLDMFICQFGDNYGCMTNELQGLFTAHRLTVWKKTNSGATDPQLIVTNKRVGDVSVSGYVTGDTSYGDYASTTYGGQFWENIRMHGGGPIMA